MPAVILFVAFFSPRVSVAADIFWILLPPAEGDWNNPVHWSTGTLPGNSDIARVDNNGTALISGGPVDIVSILLGDTLSGVVHQSDGMVTADALEVGVSSTYQLSGGTLQIDTEFLLDGTFDLAGVAGTVTHIWRWKPTFIFEITPACITPLRSGSNVHQQVCSGI